MDCVRAMQAVVDRADPSHFATRFDDWRKMDLKTTAQVQHHVRELSRLNQSLEGFLQGCSSLGSLADFKTSFMGLKDSVAEFAAAKKEFGANLDATAKLAATKVVTAWKAEVQAQAEQQRELSSADSSWRMGMEARMDGMQRSLQEVADGIRGQADRMEALAASQRQLHEQLRALLGQSVEEVRECSKRSMDQVRSAFAQNMAASLEAFKAHQADLFLGDAGMRGLLESMERRTSQWEGAATAEAKQHRESAEKLQGQVRRLEDAAETAKKRQASEQAAHRSKLESLSSQVRKLQEELGMARQALQVAQDNSMSRCLLRLKDMDARGHVRVNRQSGAVRLGTPIEFAPCTPPHAAEPQFADPCTADKVILDMAELLNIFDRPMVVDVLLKSGKGGGPKFWEEAAEAQAELLQSRLQAVSAAPAQLVVRGMVAGQAAPGVVVRLDPSIFVDQAEERDKSKGKSPPPARRA